MKLSKEQGAKGISDKACEEKLCDLCVKPLRYAECRHGFFGVFKFYLPPKVY
jgi:hypothetical protein